jgi:hypothetical protein
MELDSSRSTRASKPSSLASIQEFVVFFIRYLELRLQLLGLESREAGFHLLTRCIGVEEKNHFVRGPLQIKIAAAYFFWKWACTEPRPRRTKPCGQERGSGETE